MYCGSIDSKVIDSRAAEEGTIIRRRRECTSCGKRFTTYETIETTPIFVIKSNGVRQAFDPNKLKNGIIKACEKRPVSANVIDKLVSDIQKRIYNSLEQEVSSKDLGEMVCEGLKDIDEFTRTVLLDKVATITKGATTAEIKEFIDYLEIFDKYRQAMKRGDK